VEPARRFRVVFWLVVCLGVLPSLVSGVVLLGHFRVDTICALERATVGVDQLRATARWARVHEWGRVGAMVAGLCVIAYAVAAAFERKRQRAITSVLAAGLLLPALAVAIWSARVVPWRAFEPPVSLGAPGTMRAPEEWGGPQYCLEHLDDVRRLRLAWWGHVGSGALALLLTLLLADSAARWRAARDAARAGE
jgi:hypothetical protein